MATFNVEISLNNAAFEDSSELARILRALADRVEVQVIDGSVSHNGGDHPLRDLNGNRVGGAWIADDDETNPEAANQ